MFIPTIDHIDERAPWDNTYYNSLVADIVGHLSDINGTDLAVPLTLSRASQNLNGGTHDIFAFRKWMGTGAANVCIRDVTGYGAKGDASTDDTSAIQLAIEDLPVTGGVIVFPPGTYVISSTIFMAGRNRDKTTVTLMGVPGSSALKLKATSPSGPMIQVGGPPNGTDGQMIVGLGFDGNQLNQTAGYLQSNVDLANTIGARIEACYLHDALLDGLTLANAQDVMISGCRIESNGRHGIGPGDIEQSSSGVQILGSLLKSNGTYGLLLGPSAETMVSACRIDSNTSDGIRMEAQSRVNLAGILILGNTIISNGATGITATTLDIATGVADFQILGNTITSNTTDGILLTGASNGPIQRFSIMGNTMTGNGQSGIRTAAKCRNGTITANQNVNNLGTGDYAGIAIKGFSDDDLAEYLTIGSNVCVCDGSVTPQDYGILMGSTTARCEVLGNVVNGNAVAQISDAGLFNDISHNAGY